MSSIASFVTLPNEARPDLVDGFGNYGDLADRLGRDAFDFGYAGIVLVVAMLYLSERKNIKLDDTVVMLGAGRTTTAFLLTPQHRALYLDQLAQTGWAEDELRDYLNEFLEWSEPEAGVFMTAGIKALARALGTIDEDSFALITVG